MKTNMPGHSAGSHWSIPLGLRSMGVGMLVVALNGEIVSAGPRSANAGRSSDPADAELLLLDPGAIGVTTSSQPAVWSFDQPKGQIHRAWDRAGDAARTVLGVGVPQDPYAHIGVSALGFVLAPVAAVVGGVSGSQGRLPQNKLAECEAGLAAAMAVMAQPQHLRDQILAAAKASSRRQFVALDPPPDSKLPSGIGELATNPLVGTILEAEVEELRLERKGSGDSSFALRIKARMRMLRSGNGDVISEEAFEYQSGQALFLDWAMNEGEPFQRCADTGYRRLANQIVERLIQTTGEAPIRVGVGAPKPPTRSPRPQVTLTTQSSGGASPPRFQRTAYASTQPGTLYIYPALTTDFIAVQRPLEKEVAVSEALAEVNWLLGGFYNHPNTFVSLTAVAAAVPTSLYLQAAGAVRGVSGKTYRTADSQLSVAAQSGRPTAALANVIAQELAPRSSDAVVLLDESRTARVQPMLARHATAKSVPVNWSGDQAGIPLGGDRLLEIEVLRAALKGGDGANPSLAVHLEARATLLRADNGREIYSCPVYYRGHARKFTAWAAKDARLFREELDRGYRELSSTVIDQLVARRLIAPDQNSNSFLANNRN